MSDMAASTVLSVRTRPITVDEYYRMGAVGILRPDERVELLNGRIVEMPPIGPRHNYAVSALHAKLLIMLGDRAVPFCQGPVRLDRFSEPQPDIAVVRGPRERYLDAPPTPADALVVIEITETATVAKLPGIGEQTASHNASAFHHLIRVSEVNVQTFLDARRTQRGFPSVDARAFDGTADR